MCCIFLWSCFLVLILFSQYYSRDWLGRASLKWPILCQVGCKSLTQSINQLVSRPSQESLSVCCFSVCNPAWAVSFFHLHYSLSFLSKTRQGYSAAVFDMMHNANNLCHSKVVQKLACGCRWFVKLYDMKCDWLYAANVFAVICQRVNIYNYATFPVQILLS